ncbi:MAG TPA: cytochrome b/b6 domain-containing protein [Terriglobales bacterium]|nr:cytochrome b/b6 domain-containing protein [Terriglobales bacterium]
MKSIRAIFVVLWVLAASLAVSAASKPKLKSSDCLACHNDPTLARIIDGKPQSLAVNPDHFKASVHGSLECADCHSDVTSAPHESPPAKVSCAQCHSDEDAAYKSSVHGVARQDGNHRAATCLDCHGDAHEILSSSDANSRTFHHNIPATCGSCHGQRFVMESSGLSAQPFLSYQQSIHGKAVAEGSTKAAVCTDCHHAHDILPAGNPKSSIFKMNVPETCGQCHQDVDKEFVQSIHGVALKRGNGLAPSCTDCHGIHTIKAPNNPASSVSSQAIARTTCARCHEGVRLTQEMGIPAGRVSSYRDSYHGMASQLGSTVVANCASCHGVHNILPSSDPRSTINKANLIATCGKCHPGASADFVRGNVHVGAPLSADMGSIAVRWIRWFYLPLIVLTIGGMLAHNLLVWRRKTLERRNLHPRTVVRMDLRQRLQHAVLLLSFLTLVLTGFALKYPDSWLGWIFSESVRRIVHRIAGVVMIAGGLYHLFYLAYYREGRRLVRDIRPARKDIYDLLDTLRYYLGLSPRKPLYARFNYGEKAEYWAVVWGTIVMGLTGLMMWFQVSVGRFLARWFVDAATAIHFYEAVLATLAIVVWHFYSVIFDPDVYPVNWAFWDGRMSVEHYQEEHPLAWEETAQEERVGTSAAEPEEAEAVSHKGPPG